MTSQATPSDIHERLLEHFLYYFATAYELRESGVRSEVLSLLGSPGEVLQPPVLELLPDYAIAATPKTDSLVTAGAPAETAEFLDAGLFTRRIATCAHGIVEGLIPDDP